MKLRSLSIKGFKSFANETVLHFNEDVIGIVGPNGSGKSNVVDAIRWVLGEQKNRELRLEKMQDIIFNGTKKRKEANSASVTLTFDNTKNLISTEFNTVSISRILYRSGESEYRLNDVSCRLKDIRSMFLDTGIGSDSYAIIALGMVDDILADKEQARRKMFEQAAGISKFKERKKETLSKLSLTNADLDRVEDILFELSNNLKLLERQAKRAQKYLDIKEKYKEKSIAYARLLVSDYKNDFKNIESRLNEELDKYRNYEAEIHLNEANLQAEKSKNLDKEVNLSESQKKLNALVSEIRGKEEEKNLLAQKKDFRNQGVKNLNRNLEDITKNIERLETEKNLLTEKINQEIIKEASLMEVMRRNKEDLDTKRELHNKSKSEYDNTIRLRQQKEQKLFALEKEMALTENSIENFRSDAKRFHSNIQDRLDQLNNSKSRLKELNDAISLKKEELDGLNELETQKNAKIAQFEQEVRNQKDKQSALRRMLDAKQNEYELLLSLINSMEGFPESIKYLNKNWRKDVPLLSDILDVREDYKAALEQYLEPVLNHFLVSDKNMAAEAIKMLITSQKGKANFFVLDEISSISEHPSIKNPFLTHAVDYVNVENKYLNLINKLLENVYFTDEDIVDFEWEGLKDDTIILSKNGTHLRTQYQLSGGSVGLFEGKKIGRKKTLEDLLKYIQKSKSDLEKIDAQITKLNNEINALKSNVKKGEIDELNHEIKTSEQELVKFSTMVETIEASNKKDQHSIVEIELKVDQQTIKLNNLGLEYQQYKENLSNPENVSDVNDTQIQALAEELSKSSELYNSSNIEYIKQQNYLSNLNKEADYQRSRLEELTSRRDKDERQLKYYLEEVNNFEIHLKSLQSEIEEKYIQKKNSEEQLNEAEQAFYEARKKILKIEDQLKLLTRNLNQQQLLIQNLKDQHTDIKFKISGLSERLRIEFNININEVINQEPENSESEVIDKVMADEELSRLKHKIQNFGEVNPMAVQTYNEMKERHDLINTQRADILEAQKSLESTIKEIETTATEQFLDAFNKIRHHFIDVFRSLFTEDDTCDLILLDEDNPLESDIEIIAKPKGKRPKSLSQLSGGEKTLTATALLFALYLLKPAPFCIFDEVDAPLDDANIRKFNKIIQKFSKDSQFIIVTHNKSTMAEVDILYGVYMQELGISEVTPVDFRSLEHKDYFTNLN